MQFSCVRGAKQIIQHWNATVLLEAQRQSLDGASGVQESHVVDMLDSYFGDLPVEYHDDPSRFHTHENAENAENARRAAEAQEDPPAEVAVNRNDIAKAKGKSKRSDDRTGPYMRMS